MPDIKIFYVHAASVPVLGLLSGHSIGSVSMDIDHGGAAMLSCSFGGADIPNLS